jgi:hypothetical protein
MNCLLQAEGRQTRALPKSFSKEFIQSPGAVGIPATSNQKRLIRAIGAFGRSVPLATQSRRVRIGISMTEFVGIFVSSALSFYDAALLCPRRVVNPRAACHVYLSLYYRCSRVVGARPGSGACCATAPKCARSRPTSGSRKTLA